MQDKVKILEGKVLSDDEIDEHIKKVTFIIIYKSSKRKHVRQFLDEFKSDNEKIIYAHRYPKDKETLIGIKRIEDSNYYI